MDTGADRARVLLLTGGPDHAHDFAASSAALAAVCGRTGAHVDIVDDPDRAAVMLADGYDAFVVNALRWRMLPERYDPWRSWAYHTPDATREAITAFVAAGGGLLGSHTASICFDDWPGWRDVLGGAWNWERSSHPPYAAVHAVATPAGAAHPVLDGHPGTLDLVDEVYGDLDLIPGCEVLMTARRTPDDAPQPVVWTSQYGRGRVCYDGFGHDAASITDPAHAMLIERALRWVLGT